MHLSRARWLQACVASCPSQNRCSVDPSCLCQFLGFRLRKSQHRLTGICQPLRTEAYDIQANVTRQSKPKSRRQTSQVKRLIAFATSCISASRSNLRRSPFHLGMIYTLGDSRKFLPLIQLRGPPASAIDIYCISLIAAVMASRSIRAFMAPNSPPPASCCHKFWRCMVVTLIVSHCSLLNPAQDHGFTQGTIPSVSNGSGLLGVWK